MFREAKEYGLREPELIDMGSDFRINLYRKKAAIDQNGVIDPKERDTNDTKVEPNDTNEEAILSIILKNPQATQGAIAKEVEASLSTVKRIMRSLQKSGKLRREGTNRNGSWVVTGPVSYTHLDVYKRQSQQQRGRPPSGGVPSPGPAPGQRV